MEAGEVGTVGRWGSGGGGGGGLWWRHNVKVEKRQTAM